MTSSSPFDRLLGVSPAFRAAVERATRLRRSGAAVLLTGETGVGKERFAQALHELRCPPNAPFVAVNCGAVMGSLAESEWFGYEKGAFSGADPKGKPGKIELARGGTLFLDEVGELSADMQAKLLRVLEERTYYPVGGTRLSDADCRFVAATNRDLGDLVEQGRFREDLYYRLNVVAIEIPPLRERKEDIPLLTGAFPRQFGSSCGSFAELAPDLQEALLLREWRGNVRELRNAIETMVVLAEEGAAPSLRDLPAGIGGKAGNARDAAGRGGPIDRLPESGSLPDWLAECERGFVEFALRETGGNKQAAAKLLGISRVALYNKLSPAKDN